MGVYAVPAPHRCGDRTAIVKEFSIHMKRLFASVALLASGLIPGAFAQSPTASAPAGPVKIAVIAFQVAVAQTNEGQRDFADLEKKFEPRRDQLKALSDQIDTLTTQLKAQSSTLSEVERTNRTQDIQEKRTELERSSQDAQSDYQQAMQDLYNTLAAKVYNAMEAYAKEHGFTLVLDISQQQSPILYAVASTNITNQVVDAYNLKSGIPAPPPAAPEPQPAHAPASTH
jgi:outer membrane protein